MFGLQKLMYDGLKHSSLVLATALIVAGSVLKVTASSSGTIFDSYRHQIQSNLPSGLQMRLPSQLLVSQPSDNKGNNYLVRIFTFASPPSLIVSLFSCDNGSPSCLVGNFSVDSKTSKAAQQELKEHQAAATPITLTTNVQGYLLEGSRQNPSNQFSSVMWEQDGQIYTIRFRTQERQNILYMAVSMAKAEPIVNQVTASSEVAEGNKPVPVTSPFPPPTQQVPLPQPSPISSLPETNLEVPDTIFVKKFEFEGNTAFSDEELAEATKDLTGQIGGEITLAQLLEVEEIVRKKYTEGCQKQEIDKPCYLNSGAFIPAGQTIQDGVVKIQIIEGEIEDIQVSGTGRLNPGYVRSRLALATENPFDQNRLLEALQLLQLDPLIENISAEVAAGARPERSLLDVKVTPADTFRLELFADNGRAPSVGSFRRGIRLSEANLLGFGDGLTLSYTNTDGSNAFDGSYTVPLNPRNGTLKVAGGVTDTNVVEPPFDRIDITGDSYFVELSYRQPLVLKPTEEFALGLAASRQESKTTLLGIDFPLSAGADDEGKTRISTVRFFQDWTKRNGNEVFAVRSQFSLGLDILNATVNEEPPDSRFFSWRGQAQYVRSLGKNSLLFLRSDLQLTTETVVPLEQFGLGGLQNGRGYRQDLLLTDNGFFASAEVRLPIFQVKQVNGLLQLTPFVDFGVGWNSSDLANPDPNTVLGIGLGLQWTMGDRFKARLDWGHPLINVNSSERTLQENGIYFSIESDLWDLF